MLCAPSVPPRNESWGIHRGGGRVLGWVLEDVECVFTKGAAEY